MESGAASLLAALAGEGEGEEAATASRLLRRRAAPRVPRSIWGEGSGRGQLSVLKVHSEPLLTGKRTLPEAGRRTNLKASLQPISPSAKGTLSEAINLERLSTFPRHRADDAALPYLRRQPQLLSQLQVYADVELKARGVGGARAGEPTNAASFEVWREVFARFIEAFGTYKPLLEAVKGEYEATLEQTAAALARAEASNATAAQRFAKSEDAALAKIRSLEEQLRLQSSDEVSPAGALQKVRRREAPTPPPAARPAPLSRAPWRGCAAEQAGPAGAEGGARQGDACADGAGAHGAGRRDRAAAA